MRGGVSPVTLREMRRDAMLRGTGCLPAAYMHKLKPLFENSVNRDGSVELV